MSGKNLCNIFFYAFSNNFSKIRWCNILKFKNHYGFFVVVVLARQCSPVCLVWYHLNNPVAVPVNFGQGMREGKWC